LDRQEVDIWRGSVLSRTIEGLEKYERQHQDRSQPNVYHTVTNLLRDHPQDTSDELAERLGQTVGGQFNAIQVRGIVHRMRKKLAELLFTEVAQQFHEPTYDDVIEELCDLRLLAYVQPYLPPREAAALT